MHDYKNSIKRRTEKCSPKIASPREEMIFSVRIHDHAELSVASIVVRNTEAVGIVGLGNCSSGSDDELDSAAAAGAGKPIEVSMFVVP